MSGAGLKRLSELKVGDLVEAADSRGASSFSRVYFLHDHIKQAEVIQIFHASGAHSISTDDETVILHGSTVLARHGLTQLFGRVVVS